MSDQFEYEVTYKGVDYIVYLEYEEVCLRRGNFSRIAADPDEYFGIFAARDIELEYVMKRDMDEDEDWVWVDADTYPDEIVEMAIGELKERY